MDLTAGSDDVAEAEEIFVNVPETDNHAVSGELSPYNINDSDPAARSLRTTSTTPIRRPAPTTQPETTARLLRPASRRLMPEPGPNSQGPDGDEPARGAGQRDGDLFDSGAGATYLSSTTLAIVPRTTGRGGNAADDDRGEAACRAASAVRPSTADVGDSAG